ncbi:sugar ABC transporter substrate-binding protein [Microbacterium sp.]|uniref:sugar ABC transporter substrate-binding protein n=1 Tax=Microbacterium sp. TaxID=51671 RepID=UPI003A8498A9
MRGSITKRSRALLLGAATLTSAALILTGCGRAETGADTVPSGSTSVDASPATGTVELWTQGADGAKLPEMFTEFAASNPDVTINMTEVPAEEFASKMTAAVAAGTVPDLVYIFTESQPGLLNTGGFDPVPDGLVDSADFFESMWNVSIVDGTQYGVPWYSYTRGALYRTDLAQSAGAQIPTDWDSLEAYAKKMQDSGVATPLALTVSYDIYTAWQLEVYARANGGGMVSDDLSEWTINSPENVAALEFWASLIQNGYASADGPGFLDTVPWFTQGTVSGIPDGGPWFYQWITDAEDAAWTEENVTFTTAPAGPGGGKAVALGGGSWFVPSEGKNKDAAWKFVRFMSEPESQVMWFKVFGNMPAVEAAWDDPALQEGPVLAAVREGLDYGVTTPNVATWGEVGQIIGEQIERVARGTASAQEALDAAQQQAEAIGVGR